MIIKVEGMRPDGSRLTIRKRVFMMRNVVSVVESLRFACVIWGGVGMKKEEDSHQR